MRTGIRAPIWRQWTLARAQSQIPVKSQRKSSDPQAVATPVRKRSLRQPAAVTALCLLTLLVYANSFGAGFTLDNKGLLIEDARLRSASAENVRQILDRTYWSPKGESGLYRPVTTLSYLFNYSVLGNGAEPEGYHWVNLLLQCGNVLLVYALALRLWRGFWPAVFTAALWATHPVLTESVTNIVGRADLLAGMAVLGGLLIYLRSREAAGWRRWAWLAALLLVSAIGMFSKESAAVLPAVIVLYEFSRRQLWGSDASGNSRFPWVLAACAATLLPLAAMLYRRSVVLAAASPASFPFTDNPLVAADFWTQRLTALKVMGMYLAVLAWPVRLSCDYSFAQIALARGTLADWAAWTAVAAVAAVAAILYRRQSTGFFLAAFAFVTLLPASNLLFPIGTIMAERLLYLPAIAFAGCLAAGVYAGMRRLGRPNLAPVLLGIVTALFAARTLARNADWHDALTLAASAVRESPNSFKAHKMMADALFAADASHANLDRVIEEADKSVPIVSAVPDFRNNAQAFRMDAGFYMLKGDLQFQHDIDRYTALPPAAQAAYRTALPLALRFTSIVVKSGTGGTMEDAQELLAAVYLRNGDTEQALQAVQAAQRLEPFKSALYRQMADVLMASGRDDDAAVALVEGSLVTSDPVLRERLLELYRSGLDGSGCALVSGPNGPAINPQCNMVRQHLCRAAPRALRTLAGAGRTDAARALSASLVRDSGCSAAALNR
jgi:tetratricopeptide (TPR) repeat protein